MKLDKKNSLVVSEKFFSIQGEGQTMGRRAVFLRLSGCNLLCKSDDWVCDSIGVWKSGTRKSFREVLSPDDIGNLKSGAHLIITGGEPLLHQDSILAYLLWFRETFNFLPTLEVETNGTIVPVPGLIHLINYWNVSPKLSNSGESVKRRFNLKAIEVLSVCKGSIFKFVVNKRKDIGEILLDFRPIVGNDKIWLMPAADNREDLDESLYGVAEICLEFEWNFCTRLQIHIWDKTTGV